MLAFTADISERPNYCDDIYIYIYIYTHIHTNIHKYIIHTNIHAHIRGGGPKILGIVTKKYLKYLYKFETLFPFELFPMRLDAVIPAPLPMLETLSKIFNGNAVKGRQRIAESALIHYAVQPFTESDDNRCCGNIICPPEDGHVNARNMSRIVM